MTAPYERDFGDDPNARAKHSDVRQIAAHAVNAFLTAAKNGDYPPFGLLAHPTRGAIAQGPTILTAFDRRDPFSSLGKAVGDTMDLATRELADEFPAIAMDRARANMYPGPVVMSHMLAMVPNVYNREQPQTPLVPAVLTPTAHASYNDIIRKHARHSNEVARTLELWNHRVPGKAPTARYAYEQHAPLAHNIFSSKNFALVTAGETTRLVNPTFEPHRWELREARCKASEIVVNDGDIALHAIWEYMVDIADANHYADPGALAWALR